MRAPATLIERRRGQYYCSKCMMRQLHLLEPYCDYCGTSFSNWEELATELYLQVRSEELEYRKRLGN